MKSLTIAAVCSMLSFYSIAQRASNSILLRDIHLRDVCILPDKKEGVYYMVGSGRGAAARQAGGPSVVLYTSKDLMNWQGPQTIFVATDTLWGDTKIEAVWAPEIHCYKGRYYLFLTFSTNKLLPEQWLFWRPRVIRASQILVGDAPTGPFKAFHHYGTTPEGMMTLDGTLYEEAGTPYMVYAHEWVQISNGTIECIPLKDDLSEATGPPQLLFRANSAPWVEIASKEEGCYVTDAPYFHKSKSGRLFMIWSSFTKGGYSVGVAVSPSGKLAGPWVHHAEPLYTDDGGHGMIFKTLTDNKLMMVLHAPNTQKERPRIFELEDTGETLKITKEFGQ